MKKNKIKTKKKETEYGETIPSTFNWLTPDIQAKRAEHLAKATKK